MNTEISNFIIFCLFVWETYLKSLSQVSNDCLPCITNLASNVCFLHLLIKTKTTFFQILFHAKKNVGDTTDKYINVRHYYCHFSDINETYA